MPPSEEFVYGVEHASCGNGSMLHHTVCPALCTDATLLPGGRACMSRELPILTHVGNSCCAHCA